MSSVNALTQEWMDLVLSKHSVAADLSTKMDKLRMAKSDEMKYVPLRCVDYVFTD